jgi:hypothetical protein
MAAQDVGTSYAQTLRNMELAPPPASDHASQESTLVQPASYEIQTFDGSNRFARNLETLRQEFSGPETPRWRWLERESLRRFGHGTDADSRLGCRLPQNPP